MSKRLTDTKKWDDAWFCDLEKDEKLLFLYMQDNVDNAGFLELNFKRLYYDLELSSKEIIGAIKGLSRGLLGANDNLKKGDKIYLKNFLLHQKMNPLNPFNPFHRHALKVFESNFDFVETEPFLTNLKVIGAKTKDKKIIKKIDTNLLNYLKNEKGLVSPIVEVIVKGEVEVKETFGKSENLLVELTAYQILQKQIPGRIEAFEMKNKKTFSDYEKFKVIFNNTVIKEQLELAPEILYARLEMLNANWDKKKEKPSTNVVLKKVGQYD